MFLRTLLLLFGVFCCSTAVIFIKESTINAVLLSALRLLTATVFIFPFFLCDFRKKKYKLSYFKPVVIPGIFLGLHFITWIYAVPLTAAVNASLIVNLVPIAMPFIIFFMIGEKIKKREIIGTVFTIMGLLVLVYSDYELSGEHLKGDIICLFSMILFTVYLALAKKNCHFDSMWLYIFPLYLVAGIFCFICSLFFVNPFVQYSTKDIIIVLGLALIPTFGGHTILNYSMKHLRSQIVSMINAGQFITAGIMAYFFFTEIPPITFYISAILLVSGVLIALRKRISKN
jgi:drug/metabolite transporter (DMT)-like permease